MKWQPEHIACMRRGAFAGLSLDAVASEINRRFGKNVSRNAVGGAAFRYGVAFLSTPGRKPSTVAASPPLAPVATGRGVEGPLAFVHCTIWHHTNATCRWPVCDRDPILFCGSPQADIAHDIPYCPKHARLAYNR